MGQSPLKNYAPSFTLSDKAVNLISEITAAAERYKLTLTGTEGIRLRKINRIKTIRGSTAIEGNTLSEDQITAILDGKRVVAPKKELDEVLGAAAAYEQIERIDPFRMSNLLKIHHLMMGGTLDAAGAFRTSQVGVIDGAGDIIHMAPPAEHVPKLMKALFKWLKTSPVHPLIKSCVFHYEFEQIHPFADGNGRMGRFWQTALLGKWYTLFYAAPVENMIWENQQGYYLAIRRSSLLTDSGLFIDFMLERILDSIRTHGEHSAPAARPTAVRLSARERDLLELLRLDGSLTATRIAETYSISTRQAERLLTALKQKGFLARRGSNKRGSWIVKLPSR